MPAEQESKPAGSSSRCDSNAAASTSTGESRSSSSGALAVVSSRGSGRLKAFVQRWLTTLTLVGAALGVVTGILCKALLYSDDAKRCPTDPEPEPHDFIKVLSFPGQLWVRALKLMVVPMIFASMIVSVSAVSKLGSTNTMASLAVRFYMATTACAAITGIVLFNMFRSTFAQLGELNANDDNCTAAAVAAQAHAVDDEGGARLTILDTLLKFGFDLVPDNLVAALLKSQLLGVITFAIFFGTMLEAAPHGQVVVQFFEATFSTFVAMIKLVILFTPVGVGSLVAGSIATSSQLELVLGNLGALFGVVLLGQVWHSLAFYGSCYFAAIGRSPLRYFAGLPRVWVTAFGTSSSAATLSTTSRCCEALGVSKEAINFVLPIGCTVNMDGSALERPIVVLWIAHCAGFPLSFGEQLVVALTSALLSIGSSPIPSAGISTLLAMVQNANVPLTPRVELLISFCLAIEWLFDSLRTTVNVTGDAVGVAIIDHLLQKRARKTSPMAAQDAASVV